MLPPFGIDVVLIILMIWVIWVAMVTLVVYVLPRLLENLFED